MKKETLQLGQSLFEVILALAVIMMILLTLVSLSTLSIKNTNLSQDKALSTRLTQEMTEWLRSERDNDWDNFAARAANPVWCMPELNWTTARIGACTDSGVVPQTQFKREVHFVSATGTAIEVEVVVYWTSRNNYYEIRSTNIFTNWQ